MKNQQAKTGMACKIPPPPDAEADYDALIAYHKKYSMEELDAAGYLEEPSPEHVRDVASSATFQLLCRNGLRLELSRKDYEKLSRLAAQHDTTAEDLVKRWIRERLREESKRPVAKKR